MRLSIWRRLLDFVSPRMCVICGRRLSTAEEVMCGVCTSNLPRTGFAIADNPLLRMFFGIISVEKVTAFCYYSPGSPMSQAVYDMKYHDRPDVGVFLGKLMATELSSSDFFDGIDFLVPLPLARKRRRQRGYNQSRLLAEGISEVTRLPIADTVVCRTVFKESQTRLSRHDRQQNVENVFSLKDGEQLCHRHVLLIDDIVTTGATVTSCAQELLKVEGLKISILAFGFAKG